MRQFLIVLLSLAAMPVLAEQHLSGKVTAVIDGNTIELAADDKDTYKISLQGIDCPEIGQEFADKAKKLLEKILLDKTVTVDIKGKDRWGVRLGVVLVQGTDPRVELLKEGLAWTAEVNPNTELEEIKEKAREKGKGLWKQDNPTPPWVYRRQQSMMAPKSS